MSPVGRGVVPLPNLSPTAASLPPTLFGGSGLGGFQGPEGPGRECRRRVDLAERDGAA